MGEYMKTMIELMQYVLTVSSYDHTALMVCHLTDRIPLRLPQPFIQRLIVEVKQTLRKSKGTWHSLIPSAHIFRVQFRIGKGSSQDNIFVIKLNTQLFCNFSSNLSAACTEFTGNGNHFSHDNSSDFLIFLVFLLQKLPSHQHTHGRCHHQSSGPSGRISQTMQTTNVRVQIGIHLDFVGIKLKLRTV